MLERWQQNLRALWTAQAMAMIAMSSIIPFLPLFIRQLGVSSTAEAQQWSGIIFAASFLTSLVASPLWGSLADRYSRKTMIVRAIVGVSVALLLMGRSRTVQELLMWRLLQGAISGFVGAALGFVAAETPAEHRGYAIGVLQTSQSVGAVIGPFFGGALAQAVGIRAVFWIMSGLCLVSCAIVIVAVKETRRPADDGAPKPSVLENIRSAWHIPSFMATLGCIVLSQMGVIMPSPQMLFFLEELGIPSSKLQLATGVVVGVTGLSTLIAAPLVGKQVDRRGAQNVVQGSALVATAMMLLQAIAPNIWVVLIARIGLGVALSGLVPALNAYLSLRIPEGRQSGMMALATSAMLLGNLLGPPVGGVIAAHGHLRLVFVVAALCTGAISVVMWSMQRRAATTPQLQR